MAGNIWTLSLTLSFSTSLLSYTLSSCSSISPHFIFLYFFFINSRARLLFFFIFFFSSATPSICFDPILNGYVHSCK